MDNMHNFLVWLDGYIGGSPWFVYLLLLTGLFFTFYLGFPQIRYFRHALRVVSGKYDRKGDVGDTSHFQALTAALSGTIGTGNIAGVALAIHLGGPAALFWMLVTGMLGMTTKFVEVVISYKYRQKDSEGRIAGGPMYYMKKRLNIPLPGKKVLHTGTCLGAVFAIAAVFSSFGVGCLPQINSIAGAMYSTFGIPHMLVGAILAILLAFVILGGIKRIARVTCRLVPAMTILYLAGAFSVLVYNYENIIPSIISVFSNVFTGTAAGGGFLGASFAYAFNRGVNRGLFSNEAGQGSAPIAHSAARAHESVSEGVVALLEPFIDTVLICTLTGLVLLSSGVWNEKIHNDFQRADLYVLAGSYSSENPDDIKKLFGFYDGTENLPLFSGPLRAENGEIISDRNKEITILHARSVAEDVMLTFQGKPYSGEVLIEQGRVHESGSFLSFSGRSLIHSAPMTAEAFTRSFLGRFGQYIVAFGLLLFAFSTAISWSYYGDRSVTYLFGTRYVLPYRILYVLGFFLASFTDTTIVWAVSYITVACMTIPNLIGILLLHKEIKETIAEYWKTFRKEHPDEKTY